VIDRQIGSRYELLDRVGRGAMGEVWRAQTLDGDHVAVKILRPELTEDPALVSRFLREKELLARVDHPAVVRVRDLVVDGGRLAIVMDLIDGGSLRQLLVASAPLSPNVVAGLAADVADGLAAVHACGIVHRDVKPENILVESARGHALVTDFGISGLIGGSTTRMTKLVGSPEYMSPELVERTPATSAVDVYGLGIVLFELLAGITPFAGGHEWAVLERHRSARRPRLPWAPEPLTVLLDRMLDRAPAARPTAAEVAERLRALPLGDLGPQPHLDPFDVAAQATLLSTDAADADGDHGNPVTIINHRGRSVAGDSVSAPTSAPRRRRPSGLVAVAGVLSVLAGAIALTVGLTGSRQRGLRVAAHRAATSLTETSVKASGTTGPSPVPASPAMAPPSADPGPPVLVEDPLTPRDPSVPDDARAVVAETPVSSLIAPRPATAALRSATATSERSASPGRQPVDGPTRRSRR